MDQSSLIKQNQGMEASFLAKNIEFVKQDNLEDLESVKLYNTYLKEISQKNRKPVEKKVSNEVVEKAKVSNEVEASDVEEKKPTFTKVCEMDDIKRAFFSNTELNLPSDLRFYTAEYAFADEFHGLPDYVVKNRVKGFVQNLDDLRPYFLTCFRAVKAENGHVSFPSFWLFNAREDLKTVLNSMYEDFVFTPVPFITVKKTAADEWPDDLIAEAFLH